MPVNKLKEMIIAKRIEDTYDKEEVLTLYLNTVSFGEDVFGIKMAARRFFDASLDDLDFGRNAQSTYGIQSACQSDPQPPSSQYRTRTTQQI